MTSDECAKCGHDRASHQGILNTCPGHEYRYFEAKYNRDAPLDCEYTREPVCPACGERDGEWWDGGLEAEETTRVTCGHCEAVYDCAMHVEYTFTTTIPDLGAEARAEEERKLRFAQVLARGRADAARTPPGTRVRDDRGRLGTVANAERSGGFVSVDYDDGRHGNCVNSRHLEVVDG